MKSFAALLLFPWRMLLRGFVLSKLWIWFMVPAVHCAPISIPAAIGLSMLASMLTAAVGTKQDEDWKKTSVIIQMLILCGAEAVTLALGWLVHLLV